MAEDPSTAEGRADWKHIHPHVPFPHYPGWVRAHISPSNCNGGATPQPVSPELVTSSSRALCQCTLILSVYHTPRPSFYKRIAVSPTSPSLPACRHHSRSRVNHGSPTIAGGASLRSFVSANSFLYSFPSPVPRSPDLGRSSHSNNTNQPENQRRRPRITHPPDSDRERIRG